MSVEEDVVEMPGVRALKYRFRTATDIALLELVKHYNPYDAEKKTTAWKQIVKALDEAKFCATPPSERTVKDRLEKLLAWFRKNEHQTKSRSGTEEEYGKLEILLTEVAEIVKGAGDLLLAKKTAAAQGKREQAATSKIVELAGERGKKMPDYEDEHFKLGTDYIGTHDAEKDTWMKDTGLDEADWVEEQIHRESAGETDGKKKTGLSNKRGLKSPKKDGETKTRSSRSAAAKDQNVVVEEQWLAYFRESDEKRLQLDKKKAADDHALQTKKADDKKEIRLKELDIEQLRLELQLKQLEEEKAKRQFGFQFVGIQCAVF